MTTSDRLFSKYNQVLLLTEEVADTLRMTHASYLRAVSEKKIPPLNVRRGSSLHHIDTVAAYVDSLSRSEE